MSKVPRKRVVFAICLILAILFTGTFAFTHLDHDCAGEDCTVCLHIEAARNVLKGLVLAGFVALFISLEGRQKTGAPSVFFRTLSPSLVALKVQFAF
jgi:hypothetical protein